MTLCAYTQCAGNMQWHVYKIVGVSLKSTMHES